jgi:adenosylcobinamide kinase/adenosylcobinamide-phosphate guanylyltransferase
VNAKRHGLVLGGARSGKSAWAEDRALRTGLRPVYLATAEALDDEMRRRIERHRARRAPAWNTLEVPIELAPTLAKEAAADRILLVDCLTLWLTNVMLAGRDLERERAQLVRALEAAPGPVLMVSNEVGQGVVPTGAMARTFIDEAGLLHQALARHCDDVVLVVAGLPLILKGEL